MRRFTNHDNKISRHWPDYQDYVTPSFSSSLRRSGTGRVSVCLAFFADSKDCIKAFSCAEIRGFRGYVFAPLFDQEL
jgi:hypothetical protein